ncbi:MAG: DUF2142 domain-containing protein [Janthinobacterium lividum]
MTLSLAAEDQTLVRLPWWKAMAGRVPQLGGWACIVYLATALPCVVFLAVLVPPFQAPDEPNHFRRIAEILNGGLVGHAGPGIGQSGAVLPRSIARVADSFMFLAGDPDKKYSADVMREALEVRWNRSEKAFTEFGNIAIYPPFFYGPAVGALAIGRTLDWGVMDSYRLARAINGVLAALIGAAAIGIVGRGRSLLFVILSLPMTLSLFASVSQDALMIPGAMLAVALCSRATRRPVGRGWPGRLIAALLLGAAMAGRPPYVFLLIALAIPRMVLGRPVSLVTRTWPVAVALVVGVGWIAFGAAPAQTPMRVGSGVSISGQLHEILRHPMLFPSALWNTLSLSGLDHLKEAIGVLGWLDTPLPDFYYILAIAATLIGALLAVDGALPRPAWRRGCALAAGMIMASVAVLGALYLSWTPVGSDVVEGFQGRYLLPIASLAAMAVPALTARRASAANPFGKRGVFFRAVGWSALFALAIANALWLPSIIFDRYYA